MRSYIFIVIILIFCSGCGSDSSEVFDLYDIDEGEEIVIVPSSELKIPENLDVLPVPTPNGYSVSYPITKVAECWRSAN